MQSSHYKNYMANDGLIHTRYHELLHCTTKQIHSVIDRRKNPKPGFSNDRTEFGHLRHEMFLEESRRTGLTPVAFDEFSLPVDMIEQEMASEIIPGVILHSRPDAVSLNESVIIDYKTFKQRNDITVSDISLVPSKYLSIDLKLIHRLVRADLKSGLEVPGVKIRPLSVKRHAHLLRSSRQLPTYAYQLYANGHSIKKLIYMIEVWDREELKIVGYDYREKEIGLTDILVNKKWLVERAELLQSALRAHQMI